MYLYDDYMDDTMSVKSNKIVKPLKGGMQFHWFFSRWFYIDFFDVSIKNILERMRKTMRKMGKDRTVKFF